MKRIGVDCERMKYPFTGLYSFCKQLSTGLMNCRREDEELNFYVPPAEIGFMGDRAKYIQQHPLHKFYLPKTSNYDVWHCTYQTSDYYPPRNKTKVVLTVHDLNFLHLNKSAQKQQKYLRGLQQKVARADCIVANSNFVKKEIEQHLTIGNKLFTTIYSGSVTLQNITDKKPDFVPEKPYLFSIGTIAEKKNFHVLPALLLHNDLYLVIAGITQDKNYRNKIIETARKLGVENRVLLPGAVSEEEKYWLIKNCRLFCFPSVAEGYGLPVIEAMHFGKPCLLSKYTSLPEIGGPFSFYMQDFDADYLGDLALEVLHSTALNDTTEEIKNWSLQFSWQKTADQYMNVYRSLY